MGVFMNYELLSTIYYKDEARYNAVYRERFESICTVRLPVHIHGQIAFYMHLPAFSAAIERIYQLNQSIEQFWNDLPSKAQSRYFTKAMFSEIQNSNTIEGVHSSRKELQKAYDSTASQKNIRFNGLVRSYRWLDEKKELHIAASKDLRDLYDHTFLPDIAADDKPDGMIFRKGGVDVHSVTDKVIHRGIAPEGELIAFMDAALQYFSQPSFSLLTIAAFHYLFGYAHPFYDGNGRTVRLLSTLFLAQHLNQLIGLNLSATIFSDRNAYYKAFDLCNERKNRGDITHFVAYFLDIIERSAESMREMLKESSNRFANFAELLHQQKDLPSRQSDILHLLIQVSLFSDNGISIGGIARHIKTSYQPARDALTNLMEQGFPVTSEKRGNQILYRLDLDAFEQRIKGRP